jgi:hypothetical protein
MSAPLVPIKTGTILSQASEELSRQLQAMVPAGKSGAAMTIVDKDGVRIGIAATYKGDSVVSLHVALEVQQRWAKEPPSASLKLKAVW